MSQYPDEIDQEVTDAAFRQAKERRAASPAAPCSPDQFKKLFRELEKAVEFVRWDLTKGDWIRATHSIEGIQLAVDRLQAEVFRANDKAQTEAPK